MSSAWWKSSNFERVKACCFTGSAIWAGGRIAILCGDIRGLGALPALCRHLQIALPPVATGVIGSHPHRRPVEHKKGRKVREQRLVLRYHCKGEGEARAHENQDLFRNIPDIGILVDIVRIEIGCVTDKVAHRADVHKIIIRRLYHDSL